MYKVRSVTYPVTDRGQYTWNQAIFPATHSGANPCDQRVSSPLPILSFLTRHSPSFIARVSFPNNPVDNEGPAEKCEQLFAALGRFRSHLLQVTSLCEYQCWCLDWEEQTLSLEGSEMMKKVEKWFMSRVGWKIHVAAACTHLARDASGHTGRWLLLDVL